MVAAKKSSRLRIGPPRLGPIGGGIPNLVSGRMRSGIAQRNPRVVMAAFRQTLLVTIGGDLVCVVEETDDLAGVPDGHFRDLVAAEHNASLRRPCSPA